jgi:hypothetical protein
MLNRPMNMTIGENGVNEHRMMECGSGASPLSRLLINHSLLPLSYLPRKGAGERIEERSHLFAGCCKQPGQNRIGRAFFNTLLGHLR